MTRIKSNQMQAARAWREEQVSNLEAHISIQIKLVQAAREELAKLRRMNDVDLYYRFGAESPAAVAHVMREKDQWVEELGTLWLEGTAKEYGQELAAR